MANTIASHVTQCLDLFRDGLSVTGPGTVNGDPLEEKSLQKIRDEHTRFKIWSGNIGAHREGMSSLDYRLRDSSHIHDQIIRLLQDLKSVLEDVVAILSGKKIPWDQLSSDEDSEDDEDEDSDDHNNKAVGSENDDVDTELSQLTLDATDVINCLLRMSITIRDPSRHDRFTGSQSTEMLHFEPFDIQHVCSKFDGLDSDLAVRLGKAITRRRQYFKYREAHYGKLSYGLEDLNAHEVPPETIASSIPDHLKDKKGAAGPPVMKLDDGGSDSGFSQTSYALTMANDEQRHIPPLPEEASKGPFQCPFCFMIVAITSRSLWNDEQSDDYDGDGSNENTESSIDFYINNVPLTAEDLGDDGSEGPSRESASYDEDEDDEELVEPDDTLDPSDSASSLTSHERSMRRRRELQGFHLPAGTPDPIVSELPGPSSKQWIDPELIDMEKRRNMERRLQYVKLQLQALLQVILEVPGLEDRPPEQLEVVERNLIAQEQNIDDLLRLGQLAVARSIPGALVEEQKEKVFSIPPPAPPTSGIETLSKGDVSSLLTLFETPPKKSRPRSLSRESVINANNEEEDAGYSAGSSTGQGPLPHHDIDTIPKKQRIDVQYWENVYPTCQFCGQNRGRYNYKQRDQFAQHFKDYHGIDDARIADILAVKPSESAKNADNNAVNSFRDVASAETGTEIPAKVETESVWESWRMATYARRREKKRKEEAQEQQLKNHVEQIYREFEKEREKDRKRRAANTPHPRPFLPRSKPRATFEVGEDFADEVYERTDVEEESAHKDPATTHRAETSTGEDNFTTIETPEDTMIQIRSDRLRSSHREAVSAERLPTGKPVLFEEEVGRADDPREVVMDKEAPERLKDQAKSDQTRQRIVAIQETEGSVPTAKGPVMSRVCSCGCHLTPKEPRDHTEKDGKSGILNMSTTGSISRPTMA
ncbi:hypothetical protein EKO27_g2242 [Xylaria grammica]|uniref:Oxidoreductase acuF-like C2H2 type zinc-finger domain-containing protein n=1 Tax=Xylaria grammica TaxID=363999 RepID=A0A439DEP8_9PEZI|nr:hypothetical protein EKO27_g2242 [Xylaria grammica]